MGVTRTMESKRPVYEIPVWRNTEQAQEQDTADLISVQEQDSADLISAQEQGTAALIPVQEQDSTTEEAQMPPNVLQRKRRTVPIQEKCLLTLEEAAEYTGLGMQKLRDISNFESCRFVLWNGAKRMFKRKKLEAYLEEAYSI